MRKIIHVDMDAFFTSVEQRDRPELRGRPVVVGGQPERRGVVAGASYEARRFGVRSAMSSAQAKRLCPDAVFLSPDIDKYRQVSAQIQAIFRSVTNQVEPLSLDEAYLDVTENLLGEPLARTLALHIKQRIKTELNLTASAGVGPNPFIAKLASDLRKPDGLVVIPPEKVEQLLRDLPVEKFWGVGPKTQERLHSLGIHTARDLRALTADALEAKIGKFGRFLHGLAHGQDDRQVEPDLESKSCGSETTFERDLLSLYELQDAAADHATTIALELEGMGRLAKTLTLKLRYSDFQTITRSRTLARGTADPKILTQVAQRLLREGTEAGSRPVRLIGVSASGLYPPDHAEQLWLEYPMEFFI